MDVKTTRKTVATLHIELTEQNIREALVLYLDARDETANCNVQTDEIVFNIERDGDDYDRTRLAGATVSRITETEG